MDQPVIIAGLIALISAAMATTIAGVFACFKASNAPKNNCVSNGLVAALSAQTKAMADLTGVLREVHLEDRQAHEKMVEALTILVERTKG